MISGTDDLTLDQLLATQTDRVDQEKQNDDIQKLKKQVAVLKRSNKSLRGKESAKHAAAVKEAEQLKVELDEARALISEKD